MIKGQRSRRDDREVPTQKRGNKSTKKILGSQSAVEMQQQTPPFGGKKITAYLFVGSSVSSSCFQGAAVAAEESASYWDSVVVSSPVEEVECLWVGGPARSWRTDRHVDIGCWAW